MAAVILERPSCPLCGHEDSKALYERNGQGLYGIRLCQRCGMGFLSPRPTEESMMAIYQQDDYFKGADLGYIDYVAQEHALRATFRKLFKTLSTRAEVGGSLLEIGCGYGYLIDEASAYFDYRVGADFSAGAALEAQSRANCVYVGGLDALSETASFDWIIASHVIEHVYRPHDFIRGILVRLRPGGQFVIATPDFGSLWRRFMGSRWPSFKLPEHVLYFERSTMLRFLEQCGARHVQFFPYPHAFPVPLIAKKLGIALPFALNQYHLWLPGTTLACIGAKE